MWRRTRICFFCWCVQKTTAPWLLAVFYEKVIMESRKLHPEASLEYEAVEAIFAVSGIVGVLEQWLRGGMRYPRAAIAGMLHAIMCKLNARPEADSAAQ